MNIKNLKPKANSRYKQGYVNSMKCKKLFDGLEHEKIIFRSSWEKTFIGWCEKNDKVYKWGSEPGYIEYYMPDGSKHHYYPDFQVVFTNGDKWLVEIKPYSQTQRPLYENSEEMKTYIKNRCKWAAAKKLCDTKGWKFIILTEKTINRLI